MLLLDRYHLLAEVHTFVAIHIRCTEAADDRAKTTFQVWYRWQFTLVRATVVFGGSIAEQLLQLQRIQRVKAVRKRIAVYHHRVRCIAVRPRLLFRRYFQPASVDVAGFVDNAQFDRHRYPYVAAEKVYIRAPVREAVTTGVVDDVELITAYLDPVYLTVIIRAFVDVRGVYPGEIVAADGDRQVVITNSSRLDLVFYGEGAVSNYFVPTVVFNRVAEVVVAGRNAAYQPRRCIPGNHPDYYRVRARARHLAPLVRYFYFYFCYDLCVYFITRAVIRYFRKGYREARSTAERAGRDHQWVQSTVPVVVFARARHGWRRKVPYLDDLVPVNERARPAPVQDIPGTHHLVGAAAYIDLWAVRERRTQVAVAVCQVENTANRQNKRVARRLRRRVAVSQGYKVFVALDRHRKRRQLYISKARPVQRDRLRARRHVALIVNRRESTRDHDRRTVAC